MKKFIFSLAIVLSSVALWAQPDQGNPAGAPVPIDGGLTLLLAAGAAYGGKKAYDAYRQKEES